MKNTMYIIVALMLFVAKSTYSQTDSKGFNFQGYAVDPDGKALGSSGITVKFTIYPQGGSDEYVEELSLTTDVFGVFNAIIGSKVPADFAKLNFNMKAYKLKVEVKKTSIGVYTTISDALMQSVPYARSAANGVPVGTVISFAGPIENIPAGWLLCDGRSVTQSEYPQLYAAIGNAWGASGSNFNIPDLRGYFLRGVNGGTSVDPDAASRWAKSGGNSGDKVGSYENDQFKSHNHTGNTSVNGNHNHAHDPADVQTYSDGENTSASVDRTPGEINIVTPRDMKYAGDHNHTLNIDNNGGLETRSKNAYVYFIIKY